MVSKANYPNFVKPYIFLECSRKSTGTDWWKPFLVNTLLFRSILRGTHKKSGGSFSFSLFKSDASPPCWLPSGDSYSLSTSLPLPPPAAKCIIKKSKLEVFCISSFWGFFLWHIHNWQLKLDMILKSVTEVLCFPLCPRLVMVWNQLEYTVIVIQSLS